MKIDDKDIEKMLENFNSEEIEVPKELDERLNQKLKSIKPKKSKKVLIATVASILVISLSYTTIHSFKTFADGVIKYIFGDAGIDNAVEHGYELIPSQTINIKGYEIKLDNIYVDRLRIGADVEIISFNSILINNFDEDLNLVINVENINSSYGSDAALLRKGSNYKGKVEAIGDAITQLYNKKQEKIEIELELIKNHNYELDINDEKEIQNKPPENNRETIGKYKVILDVPKEVYDSRDIPISKIIKDDNLNLEIQKLEISPTMMYLDTKGKYDEFMISGLYNLQIISNEKTYKENLSLMGMGNENLYKQTIVPSIYYDNGKKVTLKADGVRINYSKNIEIEIADTYPKNIDYFNDTIIINKVERMNNELQIEVIAKDTIESITGSSKLDGILSMGNGITDDEENKQKIYTYFFDVEEKDKYTFKLDLVVKYPKPIELDLKLD